MEQKVTPPFAHDEPGGRYESGEVAQFIERPGLPLQTALRQIRRYAADGFVHPRGQRGSGATAPNLFAPSDVAAAAVLSALNGCGIQDHELMAAASAALYGWQRGYQTARKHHPITCAVYGVGSGEAHWRFEVSILHDITTGQRAIKAFCYDSDDPPRFDRKSLGDLVPIGSISIELSPLLLVITSRIKSYHTGATADA